MMVRSDTRASAMRLIAPYLPALALCAAMTFFLWMFLAANSLERTAEAGRFLGAARPDATRIAESYSLEWRHGMIGGWPLYVPGFFALGIATVLWSSGRRSQSLFGQGVLALVVAALVARLLEAPGARLLIASFEHDTGLSLAGSRVDAAWSRLLPGMLTVTSWVVLMVASQLSVTRRSIRLMLVPLACYVALLVLRPGDFGELVHPWMRALGQGDGVAIFSTALAPIVAIVLWRCAMLLDAHRRPLDIPR